MSELENSIFTTVETAWSADSGGYDEIVRRQLQNRRDVRHWQRELGREPRRVLDVFKGYCDAVYACCGRPCGK